MSKIIRVFACLFTLFFVGSAYAAGYTCNDLKKYTSCASGFYMVGSKTSTTYDGSPKVGNRCIACSNAGSGCTCAGSTNAPSCGVTCPAGKYLPANKSSESDCTTCENGYYCPGGTFTKNSSSIQGRNSCPTANSTTAAASSAYPDVFYPYTSTSGSVDKTTTPTRNGINNQSWNSSGSAITDCKANYGFSGAGGYFQADNVRYNTSTSKYDNFSGADIYYRSAVAGYYLYTKYSDTYCNTGTNRMLYRKAVACPAGSYCPGGSVPQCSTGTHNNEWGRNTCPAGKYCPAKSSAATNCAAGTYRSATGGTAASSCTACAIGSYSSAGATGCTACSGGKTTTATGQSSCNATCTNATGASTWTTATWSANSVTNKCAINACATGYTRGGTASSTGTSSYTCSAKCNAVTLNATTNGGSANSTVYKRTGSTTWYSNNTCSTSITSITKPTKTNATYAGHYNTSSNSGRTQCVNSSGTLSTSTSCNVTGSTTFYARYNCNTGYTASGTTIAGACAASCIAITLNNTQNGGSGGTTTLYKRVGSSTIYSNSSCSTALTLTKPSKTNATYAGHYNTTSNSGGTQCLSSSGTWNSGYNPTSATTCYARYNCNTGWTNSGTTIAGTCAATCNAITMNATQNGGSGTATTLYKKSGSTTWYSNNACSTTITTLSSRPTKTHATYAGHYNTSAASGGTQCVTATGALSTSTSCNVTGATTFYPQFTCNTGWTNAGTRISGTCTATTNTITLNKNGGTGTCGGQSGTTNGSTTCSTGSTKSLPTWDSSSCSITNGNKIFKGWSTSSSATSGSTSITCPTGAATYYAAWTTPTCSATNGTCAITTPSSNAPRGTISCSMGYSQSGGTNRTTSFTVTGSAGGTSVSGTCYAVTSTVSFNLNGGSGNQPNNVTATYGSNMPALSTSANPSRTGYTFGGWYDTSAATGGTQYYNTSRGSARTWNKTDASVTLYARWTANTFTVVYNLNNGTGTKPANKTCTYNSACALDAGTGTGYYRNGYVLKGWSTNSSATSGSFDGKNLAASGTVNVHAVWAPCGAGTAKAAGTAAATTCTTCVAGTYNTTTGNTSCATCPAGKYCTGGTNNTTCAAGTYRSATGGKVLSDCAVCSGDTYNAETGKTSCSACPDGYSISGTAAADHDAKGDCKISCSGGNRVATSDAKCTTSAGTGYYIANHTVSAGTTSPAATQCPANYRSGVAATSEAGCSTSCAGGTYVENEKAACTSVGTGYYRAAHTVTYGNVSTRAQCPVGYRDGAATDDQGKCVMNVVKGKYVAKANDEAATKCAAGTARTAHTVTYGKTSSCSACTGRTKWSAEGAETCSTVSNGYYTTGCTNNNNCTGQLQCTGATYCSGGVQANCPAQTSGWTRNGGTEWTAVTQCNQTKAVGGNCSEGTLRQNAISTTAWGSSVIHSALKAKAGYIVNGQSCTGCAAGTYSAGGTAIACSNCTGRTKYSGANAGSCSDVGSGYYTTGCNASGNNCTGRTQCSGSTYCVSGVQNNCPAAESAWTLGTGTGWSAVTSCFETKAATAVSTYCSEGQLKKNATNTTTWGAATISSAFKAKAGSIVSGQTCTQCTGATYSAGGTVTECAACPTGYASNTTAGKTVVGQCQASCAAGYAVQTANEACKIVASGYQTGTHVVSYGSKTPTAADSTSPAAGTWYSCLTNYSASGTAATDHDARSDCKISCGAGTRIASANATSCTTPSGNWYVGAHSVAAGSTSSVSSCLTNYTIGGTAATDHDAAADCKIRCGGGAYVAKANDTSCTNVGAGYWAAASTVSQGSAGSRTACASGLTTIGYGAGADEAADCGHILHLGDSKLYLRSTKKTTPSLNVKIGDSTFYGNMSTATKGKLRVKKDSTTYSVHDDSM